MSNFLVPILCQRHLENPPKNEKGPVETIVALLLKCRECRVKAFAFAGTSYRENAPLTDIRLLASTVYEHLEMQHE